MPARPWYVSEPSGEKCVFDMTIKFLKSNLKAAIDDIFFLFSIFIVANIPHLR